MEIHFVGNLQAPQCPRKPKALMVNSATGEAYRPSCQAYHCPVCGPRKVRRLARGILDEFEGSKVRLLTLTTTNRYDVPGFSLTLAAWAEYARVHRRLVGLSPRQRRYRYVRLKERHKSGSVHLHLLVDQYLPVGVIDLAWREAVLRVLARRGVAVGSVKVSNAHLRGPRAGFGPRDAVRYVCKYVLKEAAHVDLACSGTVSRNRPYSAARSVRVWRSWKAKFQPGRGWKFVRQADLAERSGLYLSLIGLIPQAMEGKIRAVLSEGWYSVLCGTDFPFW